MALARDLQHAGRFLAICTEAPQIECATRIEQSAYYHPRPIVYNEVQHFLSKYSVLARIYLLLAILFRGETINLDSIRPSRLDRVQLGN